MTAHNRNSDRMLFAGIMSHIATLLLVEINMLEASGCTDEQISSCKIAAALDSIPESPVGGVCQPKRYVHFTHLCTVTNYVPSINHCCCVQAEQVFCCRYHYDWNYFRCVEADDTIHTIADNAWPQEILLTVILVPSISGLCCLIWCIQCLLCHPDDDYTSQRCSKCACKDRHLQAEEVEVPLKVNQLQTEKQYPPDDSHPSYSHAVYCSVPSAPPLQDHITHNCPNIGNNYMMNGCETGTPQSRILLQYVVIEPDRGGNQDRQQHHSSLVSQAIVPKNYNLGRYGLGDSEHTKDTTVGSVIIQNQTSVIPEDPPPSYERLQKHSGGVLTNHV